MRSCKTARDDEVSRKGKPTAAPPRAAPKPRKKLTIALLPGRCQGRATDIAEALRESKLGKSALLLPPDEVDRALKALSKKDASRGGVERLVGQRLGASLLVSQRCVGKQVKVRLVSVGTGNVLKMKLLDQPVQPEQLKDLISLITFEITLLRADLQTSSPEAAKAFKAYLKIRSGGTHQDNFDRLLGTLEEAHKADPRWEQPRLHLAVQLIRQFSRRWRPGVLQRAERLLAPLDRPQGEYRGLAVLIKGIVAFFREDITTSLKVLSQAGTLMPDSAELHRVRSEIYFLHGQDRLAREVLLKARALDPKNARTNIQLVTQHLLSGDLEPALKELIPFLAVQDRQHRLGATDPDLRIGIPRSEGGHALRGWILLHQGRVQPALAELKLELDQLSKGSGFDRARWEALVHFGMTVAHRLGSKEGRPQRHQRRAERALKQYLAESSNPHLTMIDLLWYMTALAPDLIGPLVKRWGKPTKHFYADMLVVQAAALARMGKNKDARLLVSKAMSVAPKDRRQGLRTVYRRHQKMCRKLDQLWKQQGRKPPPGVRPLRQGRPDKRRKPRKPR